MLSSLLSISLTAFGVGLALIILLFTSHVEQRTRQDVGNVDIVIGAKGSPLQIILSSLYHIDIPTGNIGWEEAQKWMKHPQVKKAVPIALGDNWRAHRIVGTLPSYLSLFGTGVGEGKIWSSPFEAVVGADVSLAIGERFSGAHGLVGDGHVHDDLSYIVTGRLQRTGTVLDRLILTSLDSVLSIHGLETVEGYDTHAKHEGHHDHGHYPHDHQHEHNDENLQSKRAEITALLIETKSPIANRNLPFIINRSSSLQAANPAMEITRLTSMLGVGSKTLGFIAGALMLMAVFSIFAAIASAMENRKSELAVLRALGYSPVRLFILVAGEGVILVVLGCIVGGVLSVAGYSYLPQIMPSLAASGANYHFVPEMVMIYGGGILAGLVAAFIPAIRAAKIDVARQLG
jgi:putative ABC transport system permease protein